MNQDYLKELFYYKDGALYWKVNTGAKRVIGKRAGCLSKSVGYWKVKIHKKEYRLHRLIFLYHHDYLPDSVDIDHIDGNKTNNRIENLRLATRSQNCYNSKKRKNNKSGVKNVYWCSHSKKWVGRIRANKKIVFSRYYNTVEEAAKAIEKVRHKYHGEFANDGKTKEAL